MNKPAAVIVSVRRDFKPERAAFAYARARISEPDPHVVSIGGLVLCEAGVTANARNGSIDARIKIAVDIKSRRHQRSGKPPHGIADELLIALAVRFEPICIVVKSDFKQETESFRRKSIKYFFAVHIRVFAGCLLMICRNLPVRSRSETAAPNGLFNRSGFAA